MPPSQSVRIQRSRQGGLALSASHDPRVYTQAARQAFRDSFLAGIPADLPEPERLIRAEAARKLYYARLSYAAAKAKAARKQDKSNLLSTLADAGLLSTLADAGLLSPLADASLLGATDEQVAS